MKKPPRRFLLCTPVLASAAFFATCGAIVGIAAYVTTCPQGNAPPIAPTIAQWNALPPNAAFTYHVTEIRMGDPQTDAFLNITPAAINNAAQVVGKLDRGPVPVPEWWRKITASPLVSPFLKDDPYPTSAFYWHRGRVETLSPLSRRSPFAEAAAINDTGQIAGRAQADPPSSASSSPSCAHAVLWNTPRDTPRDLGAAFAPFESISFGINTQGQVGVQAYVEWPKPKSYDEPVYISRSYLWDNGALRLMASDAEPHSLNTKGESVGVGDWPAFVAPAHFGPNRPPRVLSALVPTCDVLNRQGIGGPSHINNHGDIAGTDDKGPFLLQNGRIVRLFASTRLANDEVNGLNQNGDVVGIHENPPGSSLTTPFLWRKNRLHKINDLLGSSPQWFVETVFGINDRGQIVCKGYPVAPARRIHRINGTFHRHVLVLTPVLPPLSPNQP